MAFALTSKPQTQLATSIKRRVRQKPALRQLTVERELGIGLPLSIQLTDPIIQAKLKISEPNDKYKQEADRVADQVMRMPDSSVNKTGSSTGTIQSLSQNSGVSDQVQRLCTECQAEELLQSKEATESNTSTVQPSGIQDNLVAGKGQPLPRGVRAFFEPRFGMAFNEVRIHTDRHAHSLARSVNAKAFTLGKNIVFNRGEYQPESYQGKQLIAHELTHFAQQHNLTENVVQKQLIQRENGPSLPSPPDPDVECSIDIFALARIIGGDRAAALRVINCCVNVPRLGRGCTSQAIDAACKLFPDLCRRRRASGSQIQCPPGFRPGQSSAFQGKCCREGAVIESESERECCFPERITINNRIFPRCCPPSQRPNSERTDCIEPPPLPDLPTPQIPGVLPVVGPQPDTPPAAIPRLSPVTIFFFFNSSIRRPESNTSFDMVLSILKYIPRLQVQIVGHTSLEGSPEFNQRLGLERADTIRIELVIGGIDSSRIRTLSLGESAAAQPEPPVEERSLLPALENIRRQNRRVEVLFIDPEGKFAPSTLTLNLAEPELRLPAIPLSPSLGTPQLRLNQ